MGRDITLQASDGHRFGAYRADPSGKPKGGIVVVQEIFGVNKHIRELSDGFAQDGYAAIAPALYDRSSRKGIQLGYTPDDIAKGREIRGKLDTDKVLEDVRAAFDALGTRPETKGKKLGVTGYCWGGFVTYLAACRFKPASVSAYYGGGIVNFLKEADKIAAPIQFHFGEKDPGIPMAEVDQIKAKLKGRANADVFVYPGADHGFNCNDRKSYQEAAAKLAWERTMQLFGKHLK